jgi:hypothetical protein
VKRLSLDTVISMHSELIVQSGGLDGIRDMNMLDASVLALDLRKIPLANRTLSTGLSPAVKSC